MTPFSEHGIDFSRLEQLIEGQIAAGTEAIVLAGTTGESPTLTHEEKLALILTLSRNARLYVLDEPIAGVDPAARDYVLQTILKNRTPDSTILLSTHLISEIEQYFDYVIFLRSGSVVIEGKAEDIRKQYNRTIDELFREVFKWMS